MWIKLIVGLDCDKTRLDLKSNSSNPAALLPGFNVA